MYFCNSLRWTMTWICSSEILRLSSAPWSRKLTPATGQETRFLFLRRPTLHRHHCFHCHLPDRLLTGLLYGQRALFGMWRWLRLIVGHHWRHNELWETSKGTIEKIRIPVDSVGMRVLDILLVGSKCKCLWQLRYRRNTAVESSVTGALVDRVGGVQTSSRTPDLHCAVTAGRSQMNTCNTI